MTTVGARGLVPQPSVVRIPAVPAAGEGADSDCSIVETDLCDSVHEEGADSDCAGLSSTQTCATLCTKKVPTRTVQLHCRHRPRRLYARNM